MSPGYRDIWSCLAHFWVQIFSDHGFRDVQGTVSIFRGGVLVQELQLPAANQPNSFWIGFVLESRRISKKLERPATELLWMPSLQCFAGHGC